MKNKNLNIFVIIVSMSVYEEACRNKNEMKVNDSLVQIILNITKLTTVWLLVKKLVFRLQILL